VTADDPIGPLPHPSLLAELAEAGTHLDSSAAEARALSALALAESIAAVGLQANDLARLQIRRLRIAANLTQSELARRVSSRRKLISDLETGKPVPREFVRQVSSALEMLGQAHVPPGMSTVILQARTAVAGEDAHEFEVVASGVSMEPSIRHGDRLLVSHDIELAAGRVVVAIHNGAWIVKRLAKRNEEIVLRSDNADEEVGISEVQIQGVVVELNRTL
jgi:SOS-response transcriptional repressor LexA